MSFPMPDLKGYVHINYATREIDSVHNFCVMKTVVPQTVGSGSGPATAVIKAVATEKLQ